jgi:hypothetical protein
MNGLSGVPILLPGPESFKQIAMGQKSMSKTKSGTQPGGSGSSLFVKVGNEIISNPPPTATNNHFQISRTLTSFAKYRVDAAIPINT